MSVWGLSLIGELAPKSLSEGEPQCRGEGLKGDEREAPRGIVQRDHTCD